MTSQDSVQFARGASYFIVQSVVTNLAMALSFVVLARLITTKEMGILAVLTLVNGFCQVIAGPALSQATTKLVAENMERRDTRTAASAFYQATCTNLIIAGVLALVVFFGARELSVWLLGEDRSILFQILAVDTVLYAGVLPTLTGALLGLQKFKDQATIGTVTILVRQSLIILLVIGMQSFAGLVIAWAASDALGVVIYLIYVIRALGPPRFGYSMRGLLDYAWPLTLSNLVGFASNWFDRTLLLVFVPLTTLGVYNATLTAFGALTSISAAIGNTLFSAYSSMQSQDRQRTLGRAIYLGSRYLSLTIVPLALGLLATAKPALTIFIGQAYIGGSEPLMILCGVFAVTLVGTVLSPVFLARAETLTAGAVAVSSVVISLVAGFLLVPVSGMLGASVARALGMVVSTILALLVLRRRIQLRIDLQAIAKSLIAGGIMAMVVAGMQVPLSNKLFLPAYVLVGAIAYLLMLRVLRAIHKEDIELIRRFFGARLAGATNVLAFLLLPTE